MKTLGGILLVLALVSGCGGGSDDTESATSAPKASATKSPTKVASKAPEKPATPQEQLEDALDDTDLSGDVSKVVVVEKPRTVVVTFKMADNLSNGLIRTGAKKDTMAIIGAVQELKPPVQRLLVVGTFAMQDKYGKDLGSVPVMRATYLRDDLVRIQADNIGIQDSIWDLASGGHFLNPAFD